MVAVANIHIINIVMTSITSYSVEKDYRHNENQLFTFIFHGLIDQAPIDSSPFSPCPQNFS